MSLVPSLLQAIIRVDGEALVMHVGEKPYVVSPNGQVDLATRGLTFEAVNGLVAQLLPAHALKSLEEVGATQFDLPSLDEFPGEHFTVTAARGGDDVWAEIRRRQVPDEDLVPSDIFTGLPAASTDEPEATDTDDLALPNEDQLWPGRPEPVMSVAPAPAAADLRLPVEALVAPAVPVEAPEAPARPVAVPLMPPHRVETHAPDLEVSAASHVEEAPTFASVEDAPAPIPVEASPVPAVVVEPPPIVVDEPQVVAVVDDVSAVVVAEVTATIAVVEDAPVDPFVAAVTGQIPTVDARTDESDAEAVEAPAAGALLAPAVASERKIQTPVFDVHAVEPPAPVRSWLESLPPADVWSRTELWSSRLAATPPPADAPRSPDATTLPFVPQDAHSLAEPEVSAVVQSEPQQVDATEAEPVSEPVMSTPPPIVPSYAAPFGVPPSAAEAAPAPSLFTPPVPESSLGTLDTGPSSAAFVPFPSLSTPSQPAVVLPIGRGGREMSTTHSEQGNAGLERLLRLAASRGAATVYLSSNTRPSGRVDGDIQTLEGTAVFSPDEVEAMLLGAMPDRSVDALRAGASVEWVWDLADVGRVRCTSFRDHRGPGAVFRLVSVRPVPASQLGLSREIQALASEPDGLILVSGPRSNGKSTLISSFVDLINRTRRDYVITIESEINVVHDRQGGFISQREVRGGTDDVLAAARAALREDPDILVLEDLRTSALMTVALDAAAAGQLVIGGVPAHHAAGAIDRLIDLYQPEHRRQVQLSLAQNLRGVVNQVLLRKSGGGRVAAREVLLNTPLVSSLLAEGRTEQLPVAIEGGRKNGMVPLNDALVGFVQSGAVEVREAYRRATDRAGLLDLLKRQGIDTSFAERLA